MKVCFGEEGVAALQISCIPAPFWTEMVPYVSLRPGKLPSTLKSLLYYLLEYFVQLVSADISTTTLHMNVSNDMLPFGSVSNM